MTFAPGGAFTEFSHEFQTITDAGEDTIYINREKNVAINEEVMNDNTLKELGVTKDELEKVKTAEVGNIFNFGTEKCEQLGLTYVDDAGKTHPVHLGSYGIGISRLMGVIVERFADDAGMVWPESIAPFRVHLVSLLSDDAGIDKADGVYSTLQEAGIDVLYDDRAGVRAGEKFADSDLIGIPYRIVMSKKTLEKDAVELKRRDEADARIISLSDILEELSMN